MAIPDHDVLFVGTFDDLELVQEYLDSAGIVVTSVITEEEKVASPDDTVESPQGALGEASKEVEDEEQGAGKRPPGSIGIETLGTVGMEGTSLFVVDRSADRVAVIVLAEDGATVVDAMERLVSSDFSGCVQVDAAMLCSTGVAQDGFAPDADTVSSGEGDGGGRIFILSDDDGSDGARTGAAEFEAILSESYDVTVWSTDSDGLPTDSDLDGYGAYIIDSGDYALGAEDFQVLSVLENIEDGGVMLIGAQVFPSSDEEYEPITDLKVADTTHPLAAGFASDEILSLLASESGVPAAVISDTDVSDVDDEVKVVFARGPDSPETGTPALMAFINGDGSGDGEVSRLIIATFAFYRLPEGAQRTLALNAARWLTGFDN